MFEIKYSFEAAVYYLKCSAGFQENFNDRTDVSNVKKEKDFFKETSLETSNRPLKSDKITIQGIFVQNMKKIECVVLKIP